uniref:upstream stimulatory factor 1-like n=1 Tax=Myxine glutinosa TaxID=7769 RepID=UPI00358DE9C5
MQGAFPQAESPECESSNEARFAYFPAAPTSGEPHAIVTQDSNLTSTVGATGSAAGSWTTPIGPTHSSIHPCVGPCTLAQTKSDFTNSFVYEFDTWKSEGGRTVRDYKRRAQHNEVERRRRDKINGWILQLSKVLPDTNESSKSLQSKGGILSKACDYIEELRQKQQQMAAELQGMERLRLDNDALRHKVEEMCNKNAQMRAHLQQHGIVGLATGQ